MPTITVNKDDEMAKIYQAALIRAIKEEKARAIHFEISKKREEEDKQAIAEYRRKFYDSEDKDGKRQESEWTYLINQFRKSTQKGGIDTAESILKEMGSLSELIAELVIKNHPINILLEFIGDTEWGRAHGLEGMTMQKFAHGVVDSFKTKMKLLVQDALGSNPEVALPVITHFVELDPKTNQWTGEQLKPLYKAVTQPPDTMTKDEYQKAQEVFRKGVVGWMDSLGYRFDESKHQFFDKKTNVLVDHKKFEDLRNDSTDGLDVYLKESWGMEARHDQSLKPASP